MKTFNRTYLPDTIKYNGKTYSKWDNVKGPDSIRIMVLGRREKGKYPPREHFMNPVHAIDYTLVGTEFGYNFWKAQDEKGKPWHNVAPQDQGKPSGGYGSAAVICGIKGVPNYFGEE